MNPKPLSKSSLTEVYSLYADILFRIALTHTCNREDAEDACQDVFIKYVTENITFKDREHEKAWLIRVLINHCRDLIRKHKVRSHLPLSELENVISDTDDRETYFELTEALDGIPIKYKEVIILHYLEGLSIEECSVVLKASVSAIKMRLMRAKEMIRKILKEEENNA